ncbi:MAG: hypothetical protein WAU45_16000 [Blastocatellia bacterium]
MLDVKSETHAASKAAEADAEYERLLTQIFAECAEEDLALANAGLGDYSRLLKQGDTENAEPGVQPR